MSVSTYNRLSTFAGRAIGVLMIGLVGLIIFFGVSRSNQSDETIIQNVTVIDAISGKRSNMDVTIRGGLIISVETAADKSTSLARLIDGRGKYLIPGLWDAHVHLTYEPLIDYQTFFPLALAHGVTALRDTGGHLDLMQPAIRAVSGEGITPDLFYSGPLIDGAKRIYDGSGAFYPDISVGAATADEATAFVDQFAANGASFIKAYEMLSPDAFSALAARADAHGLKVAAHVPLLMTAEEAIAAGADDFQHMRNLEFACAENPEILKTARTDMIDAHTGDTSNGALRTSIHTAQRSEVLPYLSAQSCENLIAQLSDAAVFQTPTLVITSFFVRRLFADLEWRKTFDLLPPNTRQKWVAGAARLAERPINADGDPYFEWVKSMLPKLQAEGVPLMAGTDAPIGYLTPGRSLHEELFMMVEAGLTPMDALRAATHAPAAFFNLESERGTIAPGMKADLVLLNADPLDDIRNTLSINAVIKNGMLLDRANLDALLHKPAKLKVPAAGS